MGKDNAADGDVDAQHDQGQDESHLYASPKAPTEG